MNDVGQQAGRVPLYALIIGVAAGVVCVVGAVLDWQQFLRAYLCAWLFLLGLSIGGLALVMIHNLTGGAWGLLIRRFALVQMQMLPLSVMLAIPLVFGIQRIYPWAAMHTETPQVGAYHFWQHYLEPSFFFLRAAGYFIVWSVLAVLMSLWSRNQDRSASVANFWRAYKTSGPGLVLLVVTMHFAAMDWVMSLQPGFTSTVFGPLILSSQVLAAFSLALILCCWLIVQPDFESVLSTKAVNDLGSLLFAMLCVWAYLAWFQFMLIWMADLPRGNVWYLVRGRGNWGLAEAILLVFQFVIPFLLHLFRAIKQNRQALAAVAGLIFIGQWIFLYFQIMPVVGPMNWRDHWTDALTPLALGGIWFAILLWRLNRRPLLPVHDLNYEQALLLHTIDIKEMARMEALSHD